MKTSYWAKGLEFVAAVLAAFGGFLLNVAPPSETGVKFAVGISSFLMLLGFLFVAVLTQGTAKPQNRKYWFIIAAVCTLLFIGSAFMYRGAFERYTFLFPADDVDQVRYVNGDTLTTAGAEQKSKCGNCNRAELLDKFGENRRQAVWTEESIAKAGTCLFILYVVMVLSITLAAQCLIEGLLQRRPAPPPPPQDTSPPSGSILSTPEEA